MNIFIKMYYQDVCRRSVLEENNHSRGRAREMGPPQEQGHRSGSQTLLDGKQPTFCSTRFNILIYPLWALHLYTCTYMHAGKTLIHMKINDKN